MDISQIAGPIWLGGYLKSRFITTLPQPMALFERFTAEQLIGSCKYRIYLLACAAAEEPFDSNGNGSPPQRKKGEERSPKVAK